MPVNDKFAQMTENRYHNKRINNCYFMRKQKINFKSKKPEISQYNELSNGDFIYKFVEKNGKDTFFIIAEMADFFKKELQNKSEQKNIALQMELAIANIASELHNPKNNSLLKFGDFIKKISSVIERSTKKHHHFIKNINILVAMSENDNIYFNKFGKLYTCLYRNSSLQNINPATINKGVANPNNKKIAELSENASEIFPHIINFKLQKNDRLIFFNETVGNVCDQDYFESFLKSGAENNFTKFTQYLKNYSKNSKQSHQPNFILIEAAQQNKNPEITFFPEAKNILPANNIQKQKINHATNLPSLPELPIRKLLNQILTIKLNRKNKILIFAVALIILFFSIQTYKKIGDQNKFNELVDMINSKKNEAAALILLNENTQAIKELMEAKSAVSSASDKFPDFNDKLQEVSNDIEKQLSKITKTATIDDPENISELNNFGIKFKPQNIFKFQSQLLITGSEFGLIYKIDLENKKRGFNFFSTIKNDVISTIKSSDIMAFLTTDKKIYIYNPSNKNVADFNFEKTDQQIISINKETVDVLDREKRHITILSKNNLNIIGKIPIDGDVADFSSDGKNLYTLENNNQIIKFSGKHKNTLIDLNALPLPIGNKNPLSIIANQNNNIYVIDKNEKKIINISKNGEFIGQYNINGFDKIIDIFIGENDEAFILSSDAVFKIKIPPQI